MSKTPIEFIRDENVYLYFCEQCKEANREGLYKVPVFSPGGMWNAGDTLNYYGFIHVCDDCGDELIDEWELVRGNVGQ